MTLTRIPTTIWITANPRPRLITTVNLPGARKDAVFCPRSPTPRHRRAPTTSRRGPSLALPLQKPISLLDGNTPNPPPNQRLPLVIPRFSPKGKLSKLCSNRNDYRQASME